MNNKSIFLMMSIFAIALILGAVFLFTHKASADIVYDENGQAFHMETLNDLFYVDEWQIQDDYVFINDENVYISAQPHTALGWVVFNVTPKTYTGDVDIVFGFDTSEVKPTKAEAHPHYVNVDKSYTCEHEFNYTVNPNYFWCYENYDYGDGATGTVIYFEHSFDSGDLATKTAYWTESELQWNDISDIFDSYDFDFQGLNKWYLSRNIPVEAGTNYVFRVYLQPQDFTKSTHKYWFAIKPSSETLLQAISNNHLYALDPWTSDLNTNLQSYYKLDQTSGDVLDSIGANNGTNYGATRGVAGKISYAFDFNQASTQYFKLDNNISLTGDFTINFWAYIDDTSSHIFVYKEGVASNSNRCFFDSTNGIAFQTSTDYGTVYTPVTSGSWHMYTLRRDGTNVSAFYDGSYTGSDTITGTFNFNAFASKPSFSTGIDYFDGKFDEIGVWVGRALNASSITALYNGGSGITYVPAEDQDPTAIANAPANETSYTTAPQTIDFNCTAYDGVNLTNVSLYINSTLTAFNDSGINNTDYIFEETLGEGSYLWYCQAEDNSTNTADSETRYLTIDETAPFVNITNPLNDSTILTYSSPYTVQLNATISDNIGLSSCWYFNGTDNVTLTCGDNATIDLGGGWHTLYFYANDTLGLYNYSETTFLINEIIPSVNYTTPLIEGNDNPIFFNISATSITSVSANLTWNGTTYIMTPVSNNGTYAVFYNLTSAPYVDDDTDVHLSVSYLLNGAANSTANYTQTIANIKDLNVTTGDCSPKAYNFTLVDEGNFSALNGTYEYNFLYGTSENNSIARIYGQIEDSDHFNICINESLSGLIVLGSGEIFYSSDGYAERRYYLFTNTTLTNETRNITLYDLLSEDQTSFKLEVEDTSLNPYINNYTALIRWYPELNEYNVVDMGLTDETGATVIHVVPEDVDYRIGVYNLNGSLVKLAAPIRMVCLVTPCTYTLRIAPTDVDYTSLFDVDYTFLYNETTGIWTFTFVDSSQLTSEINLTVYRMTGTSVYPVCTNSISAYTGAVTCNTSAYTGNLKGIVLRSASPETTLAQKIVSIGSTAFSSTFGLWLSMIIAIPIIFIFAFMTPLGAVIGGVIALIPAFYFGSINLGILGGIAVLGGIILHFLKRIG